jgi:hypothetical protein
MQRLEARHLFAPTASAGRSSLSRWVAGILALALLAAGAYAADNLVGNLNHSLRYIVLIRVCQLLVAATTAAIFLLFHGDGLRAQAGDFSRSLRGGELATLGLVMGLTFVGLTSAQSGFMLGKWDILVFLGLCFLVVPYLAKNRTGNHEAVRYLLIAPACGLPLLIVAGPYEPTSRTEAVIITISFLIASLPILWPQMRADALASNRRTLTIFSAIAFVVILAATMSALASLQNVGHVLNIYQARPISTAFASTLLACLATMLCARLSATRPERTAAGGEFNLLGLLTDFLPYVVILMFALRTDSLFLEGPEMTQMHWEYFVGPVRTVREGGWLLWDVPSQYGFLNVLLPALIPSSSSWQAFYLFQAATLFVAAGLFYHLVHKISGVGRLVSLLLVICAVFLAWPTLIGPAPFPSSSAARFLWCYVLLYFSAASFFRAEPKIAAYVKQGTALWLGSVLWSAESALYGTTIFFSPIMLHLLLSFLSRGWMSLLKRDSVKLIAIPILSLMIVLFWISIYYLVVLGHFPDFAMFWMYAFPYAGGYGSLPVTWDGPVWVFALVFFAAAYALNAALSVTATVEGPAGAVIAVMACILATASYYVGRAVPNNVVALFPLLCFALVIALRSTALTNRYSLSMIAVATPILSLALITPIWNPELFGVLQRLRPYPQRVESRLQEPTPSLAALLAHEETDVGSPVVYFSLEASMPGKSSAGVMHSYDHTWLPAPVALLEEPVSPTRRATVLERFMERHPGSGFFVRKRGELEASAEEWIRLISRTHDKVATTGNDQYEIIYFKNRSPN